MNTTNPPDLTPEQAAEELQMSLYTMRKMRSKGNGPPYYRITPRVIRYPREGFDAWKKELTVTATCQEDPEILMQATPCKAGG